MKRADHDALVQRACDTLLCSGYRELRADLPSQSILTSYQQPTRIFWKKNGDGHIPDITAVKNGELHIFEVETDDSIFDEHTESQLTLFDVHASEQKGHAFLVVPKMSQLKAQARVFGLGLQRTSVWAI